MLVLELVQGESLAAQTPRSGEAGPEGEQQERKPDDHFGHDEGRIDHAREQQATAKPS